MKKKITRIALPIIIGVSAIMQIACSDNKSSDNYDGPLKLTTFYPDSGYLSSKIIIEAENLGTDVSQLSVYFNKKKAFISQAAGNLLMVYAPKLPGDECVISVVKGKDSLVFDKQFRYISRFTVENVCGNATTDVGNFFGGDLASTTFKWWRAQAACCDPEGNFYVASNHPQTTDGTLVLVSEKNNLSKKLASVPVNDVLYHEKTQRLYGVDLNRGLLYEIDPSNDWKAKNKYLKQMPPPAIQVELTKILSIAYCPANDYFYAHNAKKQLFRFKLDDMVCEYLSTDEYHTNTIYNLCIRFDPKEPTKLYTSYGSSYVITVQDITKPNEKEQIFAGQLNQNAASAQDINGYRTDCLISIVKQMEFMVDENGDSFMYFSDAGINVIRKIDMQTGMVTSAVGRKGVTGNQSGTPEEATFSYPTGIGVNPDGDLYIADQGSGCVRKLSLR